MDDRRAHPRWPLRPAGLAYGGDYNPEQWPEEVWAEDVALMRTAGVNLVSVGIFSWVLLEPAPGRFDFDWLDRVMALLHDAGHRGRPGHPDRRPAGLAAPPAPARSRPVEPRRVRLGGGVRAELLPQLARVPGGGRPRSPRQLATRYGEHPALVLWHVHNEYGGHVPACYCDVSAEAFRGWLRDRYGDLGALNEAWGTTFWGQRYGDWAEIDPPRAGAPPWSTPTQQLDFLRFSNDELLDCFRAERDILHRLSPGVPVTTNFMAATASTSTTGRWAREVDVVSNDHYLRAERADNHIDLAHGRRPHPVAGRRAAVAADGALHRARSTGSPATSPSAPARCAATAWRTSPAASDACCSSSGGPPGSGRRSSTRRCCRTAVRHPDLARGRRARRGPARPGRAARHRGRRRRPPCSGTGSPGGRSSSSGGRRSTCDYRRADGGVLRTRCGATTSPSTSSTPRPTWTATRWSWRPACTCSRRRRRRTCAGYVQRGGTLVVSYFSGVVDATDAVHPGGAPGPLRDVLGPVGRGVPAAAGRRDGSRLSDGSTADRLGRGGRAHGAEPVLSYRGRSGGRRPGRHPARATVPGTAWYRLHPARRARRRPATGLCGRRAGPVATCPTGSRWSAARGDGRDYLVAINHTEKPVELAAHGTELLTGEPCRRAAAGPGRRGAAWWPAPLTGENVKFPRRSHR